jgi:hypothetical protein
MCWFKSWGSIFSKAYMLRRCCWWAPAPEVRITCLYASNKNEEAVCRSNAFFPIRSLLIQLQALLASERIYEKKVSPHNLTCTGQVSLVQPWYHFPRSDVLKKGKIFNAHSITSPTYFCFPLVTRKSHLLQGIWWQGISLVTKNFTCDKEFHLWQRISLVTKNFTCDNEFHLWQEISLVTRYFACDKEYVICYFHFKNGKNVHFWHR